MRADAPTGDEDPGRRSRVGAAVPRGTAGARTARREGGRVRRRLVRRRRGGGAALLLAALTLGALAPAQDGGTDAALGESTYATCAGCHQATGEGVPGAFPPLKEHAVRLAAAEGGRDYLTRVMLYGLQGPIEVAGAQYNGVMPAWATFDDAQIAAVLNHVLTAWGNDALLPEGWEPYAAEEVAAARDAGLDAAAVLELRQGLELGAP